MGPNPEVWRLTQPELPRNPQAAALSRWCAGSALAYGRHFPAVRAHFGYTLRMHDLARVSYAHLGPSRSKLASLTQPAAPLAALALALAGLNGCESKQKTTPSSSAAKTNGAPNSAASAPTPKKKAKTAKLPKAAPPKIAKVTLADASPASGKGKPVDIATASYFELTGQGILIRRKDHGLVVVPYSHLKQARSADGKAFAQGHTATTDGKNRSYYYFGQDHKLWGGQIARGKGATKAKSLAINVESGYPVRALRSSFGPEDARQNLVAFVSKPTPQDTERRPKLWVERKGVVDVSDGESGATSVWLVQKGPKSFWYVWADGRSALTIIHARPFELDAAGEVNWSKDRVVWMASPDTKAIPIFGYRRGETLETLLAGPNADGGFGVGMAAWAPGMSEDKPNPETWWLYPNGLDPAPLQPFTLCDEQGFLAVKPISKDIKSKRALHFVSVNANHGLRVGPSLVEAKDLPHIAARSLGPKAAYLGWVADGRSYLHKLRCKAKK